MAPGPASRSKGVGCATIIAIVFGVVVLLGLATCGGAAYWALSPGRQADTARLVGEESLAYVEIANLSSSKAMVDLLGKLSEELDRRSPSASSPEWVRALQNGRRDYQAVLNYVMPSSLVATLEPIEDSVEWMSAANFPSFTRPAQLMLTTFAEERKEGTGEPAAQALAYGDVTIYDFPELASLTFLNGTFVAAGASPAAQRAIDRLRDEQPRRPRLLELEVPRPGSWDARAVLDGPMTPLLGIEPDLAKTARLGMRLEDPDRATAYLVIDCAGEAESSSVEQALGLQLAELTDRLREEGLSLEYQVVRKEGTVDVALDFTGVGDYLLRKLEEGDGAGAADPETEPGEAEEAPLEEEPPAEPAEGAESAT
jgi:hypothetical protein